MRLPRQYPQRSGLTLLEVIVSVAIFLLGIVAIGGLIRMSTDLAGEIALETEGLQLCQSKLNEVAAGAVPLEPQTEQPFEHNERWTWSMICAKEQIVGLWAVEVTVKCTRPGGSVLQLSLPQYVLDPLVRGATAQPSVDDSGSSTTPETTTPETTPPDGSTTPTNPGMSTP